MKHRVLLIGNGHLGNYLKQLWQLPAELHWTRDMAALDAAALKTIKPDAVINAAGKTNLEWCEKNAQECFRSNVDAPVNVYRALKKAFGSAVPYIHLSSGCVWDGPYRADGQAFQPKDPPTPACFYSWSKACCDALLLTERDAPLVILRPRQLYSPLASPRNMLQRLNGYARLLDTPNSMSSADTIARTIVAALDRRDDAGCWNRILNVYERGVTSAFEVGTLLAQAGCRAAPEKLNKSDLDAWHTPRRVDTVLADPCFESLVAPALVQDELKRNIALFARVMSR